MTGVHRLPSVTIMTSSAAIWDLRESGPPEADATVLCLPGALCTAAFYADLMAEPALQSIRMVAATLPGQGGTAPLRDLSIESYARLAADLAAELRCDLVVGHSLGANVAIEMAASSDFSGSLLLLAPSLSREDESMFPRVLDRLGVVLGLLPFRAALRLIGPAMKGSLPPHRHDDLVAELRRNDPRIVRRQLRLYLDYLDRHRSVASRLCEAGVPATIVFGENDDVGITDQERRILEGCPRTHVVTIPGAGHFTANQEPGRVALLVAQTLGRAS
jgi:pimeloyl-ACP methyl ester carboxylesterase